MALDQTTKTLEFYPANSVFIYPSANSDDGGEINTEKQLASIAKRLTSKNFVVKESDDVTPFNVNLEESNEISVTSGSAVVEGYFVSLNFSDDVVTIVVDSSHLSNYEEFTGNTYTNKLLKLYNYSSGTYTRKTDLSREEYYEYYNDLPKAYVVLQLLKNTTGNVRGDVTVNSGATTSRVCKGCALGLYTTSELSDLKSQGVSYLILADLVMAPYQGGDYAIIETINSETRYCYIDIDTVYDDKLTIRDWINLQISNSIDDFNTLNYYTSDEVSEYKVKSLVVSSNDVRVITWTPAVPTAYDSNGNRVVVEASSYSIDAIQSRTQVAPSGSTTPSTTSNIGTTSTLNNNGVSNQLARADHIHDTRYICTKDATGSNNSITQQIGTNLDISHALTASSAVVNGPTFLDSLYVTHNGRVEGDLTAGGDIRANRVYNAVWNDFAELYPKKDPNEIIEPGTVICKTKGANLYTTSNWILRNLVVGVCSDTYGIVLGGCEDRTLEENLKEYVPVAVSGQVKVKVVRDREIKEGDLLSVSAIFGRATNYPKPEPGTIIGKALENTDGSKDTILMQIMLK